MKDALQVFSGASNPGLADEICRRLSIEPSPLEISRFSNDNVSVRILENVRERDVFVVQSLTDPVNDNLMALLITLDALRSASARRITAVIPYYSYARSDKKDAPRISITARLVADLLETSGANRVLTMDLHADQVHGFFGIPVDHLTAIPTLADHFRSEFGGEDVVVVASDAGAAKRSGKFAERMNAPLAIIDKRRVSDDAVEQTAVVGDVRGKDAIIFDDEIATGGTLIATEQTLQRAGARRILVGAVHPVLCGPAVERIGRSSIERVVVTNTVRVPPAKRLDKIDQLSVASLFAEAIRRIHTGESVGALFR